MEAGEILEEEEVILEAEETQEEGEVEIRPLHMTNSLDNSPQFSKAIAESLKPLCRNGPFTGASIDLPLR